MDRPSEVTVAPDGKAFELRRQIDDLIYSFERTEKGDRSGYKRADGDYWIIRHSVFGWVGWDFDTQTVMGRPWEVLPQDQGEIPPEGVWVTRKGEKSYVYMLVLTQ